MKKNLTPQQEKFIKNYVSGQTASEAVKNSYDTKKQTSLQIAQKAQSLLNNEFIKQEIEKRREKNNLFLNYSSEKSFNKIKEIQEKALEKGDLTNALKAEEMAGKLAGLFKQESGNASGILGDFKEFYAAICAKKDYGTQENALSLSKSVDLSNCPESQVIENK